MKKISKIKALNIFFLAFLLFAAGTINAQIGIGIANPAPSAQLDVSSTSKGFLPPRMTYEQRQAIVNPEQGLMIWCSKSDTSGELQVFNGKRWTNMVGDAVAPFKIGDIYGGGKVFSVSADGLHGMIASYDNLNSTWLERPYLIEKYWGGNYHDWVLASEDQLFTLCELQHFYDIYFNYTNFYWITAYIVSSFEGRGGYKPVCRLDDVSPSLECNSKPVRAF